MDFKIRVIVTIVSNKVDAKKDSILFGITLNSSNNYTNSFDGEITDISSLNFQSSINKIPVEKMDGSVVYPNYDQISYSYRDEIEDLPTVNGVSSVAGKTGAIILTKNDVGLSNTDDTSDVNKPISLQTQNALDAKQPLLDFIPVKSVNTHVGDVILSKIDIGLSNVDNTSDSLKPISIYTQTALDLKQNYLGFVPVESVAGKTGQITLNKNDVGLNEVDNTADLDKPISTDTQSAINLKQDLLTYIPVKTVAGKSGQDITLTKSDIGLNNIDNTSDINKPISLATQQEIDTKQDLLGYIPVESVNNKTGIVNLNKTDIGLSNVNNTSDADKQISTLTQNALDTKQPLLGYTPVKTVNGNTGDVILTQNDVGLSNVDNTHDADKPLSSADILALSGKQDVLGFAPVQSVNGRTGVVSLLRTDVGLGNVDNTSDLGKPISTATQAGLDSKQAVLGYVPVQSVNGYTGSTISLNKNDVGLGSVDNTSDINKPVSTAQQTAINLKQDALGYVPVQSVNGRTGVVTLTSTDVGLANVNNTSDVNKPISNLTQNALDLKAPINNPTFTGTVNGISKTMVGLPNVDNTSDINKPISTATQTALNLLAPINNPTFTGTVNGITKSMVGLGNIDNTSDLNKPISTATQSALNLKESILTFNTPLIRATNAISIPLATGTVSGYLSLTDWNTFNNKQVALGFTPENVANKSTSITLGTSDILYPTQNAVKSYVDVKVLGSYIPITATTTITISPNIRYYINVGAGNSVILNIPANFLQDDAFQIFGQSGSFTIAQNANQYISSIQFTTTVGTGGYLTSNHKNCTITMRGSIPNIELLVTTIQGTYLSN